MAYTLPIHPCTTTQVFQESGRLYKELLKLLLVPNILYCLLFTLPLLITTPLVTRNHINWVPVATIFLSQTINLFLFAWMLSIGQKWITTQKAQYKEALWQATSRFPFYFVMKILAYLLTLLSFLLLIIPGIVVSVFLAFTIPIVLLDKKNIFLAIAYSIELTYDWDRWWQSLAILLSAILPISFFTIILYHFFGNQLLSSTITEHSLIIVLSARFLEAVLLFFMMPWITSSLLIQYFNLKKIFQLEKARKAFFQGNKVVSSAG